MRSVRPGNYIRDKFENILKRGELGEFSQDVVRRDREKRHRKKNALVVREKNAQRDDIYLGADLKVFK